MCLDTNKVKIKMFIFYVAVEQIFFSLQLSEKQMRKPLAAMLPEKYDGIDVRELFPEFRPGKIWLIYLDYYLFLRYPKNYKMHNF